MTNHPPKSVATGNDKPAAPPSAASKNALLRKLLKILVALKNMVRPSHPDFYKSIVMVGAVASSMILTFSLWRQYCRGWHYL